MQDTLGQLEATVLERRTALAKDSYSARLLNDVELLRRKIVEEAHEVTIELGRPTINKELVAEEGADLLYHLIVGLVAAEVPLANVLTVLESRS